MNTSLKSIVSLCMALSLILAPLGVSEPTVAASSSTFKDIKGHWAESAILKAENAGLIDGFPDGTFRPDDVVKADQFVTMMLKAHSKKYMTEKGEVLQFDHEWMEQLRKYQPAYHGSIRATVGEMEFEFKQATSGYWAKPYIDFMYKTHTLYSFDPVFPQNYEVFKKELTREKASYLLGTWFTTYEGRFDAQYEEYVLKNTGLIDMKDFSNTAASIHRGTVLISGLMRGWNKRFYPQRYVTRAEALVMAMRLRNPVIRDPYKPSLVGQYYTEINGNIYLFSDKYKYDAYNHIVRLAKQHVTTGYVRRGALGVAVFDSQDTYERQEYMIRMGYYDRAPSTEFSVGVGPENTRILAMDYPATKLMPNSKKLYEATLNYFAGNNKGQELGNLLEQYEKEAFNLFGEAVSFTFNRKQFTLLHESDKYVLTLNY